MFHCMQTVSPFLYSCQDWYMSQIRSNACKQSTEFCSVVKTGICLQVLTTLRFRRQDTSDETIHSDAHTPAKYRILSKIPTEWPKMAWFGSGDTLRILNNINNVAVERRYRMAGGILSGFRAGGYSACKG